MRKMTKKDNDIREKILKGLELTYKKLIKSKKDRNFDLVISDKGKVTRVRAKDC